MKDFSLDQKRKEYLAHQYNLELENLEAFLQDLSNFLSETPQDYILRRHKELKDRTWPNSLIYPKLMEELKHRLFLAPEYSERQIRRIIYG